MKQEIVSGSGISWAICKSAPNSRQITTPAPHHSVFYRLDALPAAQPTVSKHWRQAKLWRQIQYTIFMSLKNWLWTSFNKLNLAHQKNKKVIKILKTKTNTLRRNDWNFQSPSRLKVYGGKEFEKGFHKELWKKFSVSWCTNSPLHGDCLTAAWQSQQH